jgi:hypothetical protein
MSRKAAKPTPSEETTAHGEAFDYRRRLAEMFRASPLPEDELLFNLGLYIRGSLLVKFVVLSDLYRRIVGLPGAILEFGVWWGQNLVLFENLRAIFEPFNKQRLIVGFDTFEGYPSDQRRKEEPAFASGFYQANAEYPTYLGELLRVHEGNNAFGHLGGHHKLIKGDVVDTAPRYFRDHPETIVALAYFDLGPYAPTIAALNAIKPHLIPGSVILFDELTWAGAPGEAIAFKEAFQGTKYQLEKCQLYPSKSILTVG